MAVGKKVKSDSVSAELMESLVSVRRVSKVVRGGRRFTFSVLVVVGDGKGRVGCGVGKHLEVSAAKNKAVNSAKKNMVRVHLRNSRTLHHDVKAKFCASKVILRSASVGTGIIAGGSGRALFEVLGIQDIVVKSLGSSNPYNYVRAIFVALSKMSSPRQVANRRNKKIFEVIEKREE